MKCDNNYVNEGITKKQEIINKIRFLGLKEVFDELDSVNYAVIKGEATSIYVHGQENKRYYNEIDILINKQDSILLERALIKHGFRRQSNDRRKILFFNLFSHQSVPYHNKYKGISILVDINYDVFWGEKRASTFYSLVDKFLEDTTKTRVYGVNIKILNIKKAFIQMCLHCYKDINSLYLIYSRRQINKRELYDIYWFLKQYQDELCESEITRLAQEYEVTPYLYVVLGYVFALTDDPLLKLYMTSLEGPEGILLLNTYGLTEHKQWRIDIKKRLSCNDLFAVILSDLSEKDILGIEVNRRAFSEEERG